MKVIHIRVEDEVYFAWKRYASQYSNYAEALINIPQIRAELGYHTTMVIRKKKRRGVKPKYA